MSFSMYSEYKTSGFELFEKVPNSWSIQRLKQVVTPLRPITYGIVQAGENVPDGIPYIRPADMTAESGVKTEDALLRTSVEIANSYKRSSIVAGDIVCSIGPSFGKLMMAPASLEGSNLTQGTARVAVSQDHVPRFVFWVLRSIESYQQWESSVGGATFRALNLGPLAETFICVPSSAEQIQIALFLDHETARIDALIEEQQRLIELLKEKRQALISLAVTKGLDPTVPMKDSGVEWLGEVPVHWKLTAVKYVVESMSQGWSPQCDNYPAEDGEWGVLKVGCVNGGIFNPAENKRLPDELEPDPGLAIKQSDLLISRANTRELVGSAAVAVSDYPWLMLCDKLYRLRLNAERVAPEFLALYLGSSAPRSQIELAASGASDSMQNISQSVVMDMPLPLPPVGEQEAILRLLSDTLKCSDELVAEVTIQRCLLQERRSALISAAVTGKIDVRGWQPPASATSPELAQEAV